MIQRTNLSAATLLDLPNELLEQVVAAAVDLPSERRHPGHLVPPLVEADFLHQSDAPCPREATTNARALLSLRQVNTRFAGIVQAGWPTVVANACARRAVCAPIAPCWVQSSQWQALLGAAREVVVEHPRYVIGGLAIRQTLAHANMFLHQLPLLPQSFPAVAGLWAEVADHGAVLRLFDHFPKLQRLRLHAEDVLSDPSQLAQAFPRSLRHLDLGAMFLLPEDWNYLACDLPPQLQSLRLRQFPDESATAVGNEHAELRFACTALEALELDLYNLTTPGLAQILSAPRNLYQLALSQVPTLDDQFVWSDVAALLPPTLTHLSVRGIPLALDQGGNALRHTIFAPATLLPNLATLHLAEVELGSTELQAVANLQHLRELRFTACDFAAGSLTSSAPQLAQTELRTLRLENNLFDDGCGTNALLAQLPPMLTSLWFDEADVDGQATADSTWGFGAHLHTLTFSAADLNLSIYVNILRQLPPRTRHFCGFAGDLNGDERSVLGQLFPLLRFTWLT